MNIPEIMTPKEVAEYLRVSQEAVANWAERGEIPCIRLGSESRFKRDDIARWLDERLAAEKRGITPTMFLDKALAPERIVVLKQAGKTDVLTRLIELLATTPEVKSLAELKEGIFHREQLMSTGIGYGIGIPHVRIGSAKDLVMAAALVHDGVPDYESLDNEPVKLIFMIVARVDQHAQHLKLLSQLSSRLKDEVFRRRLENSRDSQSFFRLLTEG